MKCHYPKCDLNGRCPTKYNSKILMMIIITTDQNEQKWVVYEEDRHVCGHYVLFFNQSLARSMLYKSRSSVPCLMVLHWHRPKRQSPFCFSWSLDSQNYSDQISHPKTLIISSSHHHRDESQSVSIGTSVVATYTHTPSNKKQPPTDSQTVI